MSTEVTSTHPDLGGVVIVGGGFAGFWAAIAARRVLRDRYAVQLVSRAPVIEIRPRLYESRPETYPSIWSPFSPESALISCKGRRRASTSLVGNWNSALG